MSQTLSTISVKSFTYMYIVWWCTQSFNHKISRLPVYTSTGKPVYAEGCVKGNKKEAVVKCALDACRLLDTEGVLRESENSKHNLHV